MNRFSPACALPLLLAAACATNPVTGERQLALISESQEIQLGQQTAQQAEQSIGLVDDAALQSYVQQVGQKLAAASERPELPWNFGVLDDPTPNAFAAPGGFIYVTRGMMALMDSEAELASVLGHEIGHVTARHSVTQLSRAQLAQIGLVAGSIFVPEIASAGQALGAGLQLLFLHYGRDAERQADELGFRYALQHGYDVRQMADVFASLQRVGDAAGQSPTPTWAASHPAPEERIRNVEARLAELSTSAGASMVGRDEYMARIDGLVYGENPRAGFFREGVFYHPDLRFRLSYPQGWQTQNLPQAVVGLSPQQDAALQLTLVGGDPAQAAQQFLGQQGIQVLQSSQQSVNGLPAVTAAFQAQTEQGVIRGWVGFLAHEGRTYQILGYSPAARFSAYEGLFRQVIGSFGPLTDPQLLGVRPNRIDILRVEQAATLAEINRRYPSTISIEELALINQLPDASARVPAGTLLKRVVAG